MFIQKGGWHLTMIQFLEIIQDLTKYTPSTKPSLNVHESLQTGSLSIPPYLKLTFREGEPSRIDLRKAI